MPKNTKPNSKEKPKIAKSKITPKRVFIVTLSFGALGGAIYLARKYYLSHKASNTDQDTTQQKTSTSSSKTYNFFSSGGDSFPLKRGSKGQRVMQLQQALSDVLGQAVIAQNGGVDGSFGKGTEDALKLAGYGKTVSESLFNQIVKNEPTIVFNPQDLASKLYNGARSENINAVLELLKQIKDVPSYTAVNNEYQKIGLVKKRIVTDLLVKAFSSDSIAKDNIKAEFTRMGLKLDPYTERWSLSGMNGLKDIITIRDTYVVDKNQNRIRVSKNTILGNEQKVSNGMTMFKAIDNSYGTVPTDHVKYV
ncbi:MAG TPA: hypothetical protein VK750_07350 [Cytophagaceae bacterium]|jgi:hypothetical protein|nr:hypothetical protein [Cytophagaceae bacterium]